VTEDRQSILSHLEELRRRLTKAALALLLASVVVFFFREWMLDLLQEPYRLAAGDAGELIALKPTEGFSAAMKLAMFGGLVLASPVLLYQLWAYVNPGVLPRGLGFLQDILDVEFTLTVGEYLSFVTRFLLVFGVAFEFPVFLFAIAATGLVSSKKLAENRRWAVVIIVTVAAIVTPTGDPYTLLFLSVPLYLLYEITIWLIRWTLKK
jgi:sec-independent protein translocase protein TatC